MLAELSIATNLWLNPGSNAFQGTREEALYLLGAPAELDTTHCYWHEVQEGETYDAMVFGKHQVWYNVVAKPSHWPQGTPRTELICPGPYYTISYPVACGNWAIWHNSSNGGAWGTPNWGTYARGGGGETYGTSSGFGYGNTGLSAINTGFGNSFGSSFILPASTEENNRTTISETSRNNNGETNTHTITNTNDHFSNTTSITNSTETITTNVSNSVSKTGEEESNGTTHVIEPGALLMLITALLLLVGFRWRSRN